METKPWQIPYPMENWKMRYMVVWIQNHDKFIVLIWKTLDMRFGCKIRINLIHSVQLSYMNFIDPMFSVLGLGFASPDMNFIDPNFFRIRTIVHCVTNSIQYHSFLWSHHMKSWNFTYDVKLCDDFVGFLHCLFTIEISLFFLIFDWYNAAE
jgi:hypothetical protein